MCYCSSHLFDCCLVAVIWNYMLSGLQLNLSVLLEIRSGVHLVLIRFNSLRSATNTVFFLHFIYTSSIWLTRAVQDTISLFVSIAHFWLTFNLHAQDIQEHAQVLFFTSQLSIFSASSMYWGIVLPFNIRLYLIVFCVMLGLPAFNSDLAGVEDA